MRPWVIQKKIDGVWRVVSSYHPTKDAAHDAMIQLMNDDLKNGHKAEAYRVYFDPRLQVKK